MEIIEFLQRHQCKGLQINSQQVTAGEAFLAYPGLKVDGRDYMVQAQHQGAVAILYDPCGFTPRVSSIPLLAVERLKDCVSQIAAAFYGYPGRQLALVGITGTNGKSSVCHFVAQALTQLGQQCGVISTIGSGRWPHLTANERTTPDPITLQKQLAAFVRDDLTHAVMEVSSHALDQNRLYLPDVDIAVFTNLTRDHLDYHGSIQAYLDAKARLFQAPNLKAIVLNAEDPHYPAIMAKSKGAIETIGYTADQAHDTVLLGEFNQSNVAAVKAILKALQFQPMEIERVCVQLKPVKGRMEIVRYPNAPTVIIDYAHTPDALEKVLVALLKAVRDPHPSPFSKNERGESDLWVVFGCGGDRDMGKRPLMAKVAAQYADHIIVTSDNPRFEEPQRIIDDIVSELPCPHHLMVISDRRKAIEYAVRHANVNDCILLAGKGHEVTQSVRGKQIPFDERTILAEILSEK